MAKKRQPKRAWEQPYDSDYWEFSPVRGYTLVVTTDDLGLYPGGRWYWFIQKPGGWEVSSSRGFRSSRQAKLAAEDHMIRILAEYRSPTGNPMTQALPGGSVSGCIDEMEEQGGIDDPGAYCAAIADRIEPGWRDENPGFAAGVLTGVAAGVAIPYMVGRSKLKLTIAEPTYFVWRKGAHAIDARLYEGYWRFQVTQDGKTIAKREFPLSADYVDSADLAWADGLEWAKGQVDGPRRGNPKKAQVSAISRRLRIP